MKKKSFASSVLICLVAYVVALFAAALALYFAPNGISLFWKAAIADVVATVAIYGFSIAFRNSSLYDPYWSVAPPLIAAYWMNNSSDEKFFVIAVILFWAIRLTLNWLRGWHGLGHQDWRYVMLKNKRPGIYWLTNFAGIHLFPTVMVFMAMTPVYFLMQQKTEWNFLLLLGGTISIAATIIEWIADEQMRKFKKHAPKNSFINTGLWRYSRHPNYFGEICFWLGLWVMALGLNPELWWTGFGWVAMTLMFLFASIPMMEEKNRKSKAGYESYAKSVSVLVPLFRKK